jgi:hypothetical protein
MEGTPEEELTLTVPQETQRYFVKNLLPFQYATLWAVLLEGVLPMVGLEEPEPPPAIYQESVDFFLTL